MMKWLRKEVVKTSLMMVVMLLLIVMVSRASINVTADDSGVIRVPVDYSSIQEAIDAASPGDIIFVLAGTYNEHIVINKSIKLIGADKTATIIDGGGTGKAITVLANNTLIDGFTIRNAERGIQIDGAGNITISNNIIVGNDVGIYLIGSPLVNSSNFIVKNIIANNGYNAIYSSNNSILENSFIGGHIEFVMSGGNRIHRNNFIDCEILEDLITHPNNWTGNFWNTKVYEGIPLPEGGRSGDKQPLNTPYEFFPIIWENIIYPVSLISNSTISNIKFTQTEKKISFNVKGTTGTHGFFNITIPKSLLKGEPWTILLNDVNVTSEAIITENQTHTIIHLTYTHSVYNIEIIGTWVVPEFSTLTLILPMFIITIAMFLAKKLNRYKILRR